LELNKEEEGDEEEVIFIIDTVGDETLKQDYIPFPASSEASSEDKENSSSEGENSSDSDSENSVDSL